MNTPWKYKIFIAWSADNVKSEAFLTVFAAKKWMRAVALEFGDSADISVVTSDNKAMYAESINEAICDFKLVTLGGGGNE